MDDVEERIRRRAYEIWEREGRPDGRDADHWRQAREEVLSDMPATQRTETEARVPETPPAEVPTGDDPTQPAGNVGAGRQKGRRSEGDATSAKGRRNPGDRTARMDR